MELTTITAVGGGLSTGLAIGLWLIRREGIRVMEAVERMPEKEWFDRVERKIDAMPDASRLETHFALVHAHTSTLTAHGLRLEILKAGHDDHEVRLRTVEKH